MVKAQVVGALLAGVSFLTNPVFAQEGRQTSIWVEGQGVLSDGKLQPRVGGMVSHYFLFDMVGLFGYLHLGEKYGHIYGGPAVTLAPWLQLGVGMGPGNAGAFLWVKDTWLAETGCSLFASVNTNYAAWSWWYEVVINAPIDEVLGVGAMAQKYSGVGPRLEFNSPRLPLTLWVAPFLYDWETRQSRALLALRFNL